jgi:magnesium transporter
VNWISVSGVHDTSLIEALGARYDLHRLTMEDIVHATHQPKSDEHEHYHFLISRFPHFDPARARLEWRQLSLVVMRGLVISFQDDDEQLFAPLLTRIELPHSNLRKRGADYLAYAMIDLAVDHLSQACHLAADSVNEIEEEHIEDRSTLSLEDVNRLRSVAMALGRNARAHREIVVHMMRDDLLTFGKKVRAFLRDVLDHADHARGVVDAMRDQLSSLSDLYFSHLSLRQNEAMTFLTIMGSVFIPLTFLAGIYGMNFQHMPELAWPYSYPVLIAVMVVMAVGLMIYFKRRKWF